MANYSSLASELRQKLGYDQVITDELLCDVLSVNASLYHMVPKVIVKARDVDEVSFILESCTKHRAPVTFRAAGTSLSGQATTDSVMLMLDDSWNKIKVSEEGEKVYCQPGVIGAHVNRKLAPYQRKLGPDPASIDSCKIGGIAANNSSGMCCGTAQNSYQTMASMAFVLADGTRVNSADLASIEAFKNSHADLLNKLSELAESCRNDAELKRTIEHKYRLKNTTGFSLNALIDFEDPLDILTHLMIGSEGCLGFISGITYQTVPDYKAKSVALYLFPNLSDACDWVAANPDIDANAIELMDDKALASVPTQLKGLIKPAPREAALLIECQAENEQQLQEKVTQVADILAESTSSQHVAFTDDHEMRQKLWAIRKGIIPSVASQRRPNTSVIIEDIAFPVDKLGEGISRLTDMFMDLHYLDISLVGHARDGNLHFIVSHDFGNEKEIVQFQKLMDQMSGLVLEYGGSLKAEHGTGRNMAPFVEQEWGTKAYQLMKELKALLDPKNLLNPGVILNQDQEAHLKNLKSLPITHPVIDQCMECGFCEPVCPTTELSLTPRQRIAMARQQERLKESEYTPEHEKQLKRSEDLFQKLAIDSCATTSMCKTTCPVNIDTGRYILERKHQKPSIAAHLMKAFSPLHGIGILSAKGFIQLRHWLVSKGMKVKIALPDSPRKVVVEEASSPQKGIYFSTCANRTFSSSGDTETPKEIGDVLQSLMKKAGIEMVPATKAGQCCGLPYRSQGLLETAESKALALSKTLEDVSENGKYPIVFDASPCVEQVLSYLPPHVRAYEACDYVTRFILPKVKLEPAKESVLLHITCSTRKMQLADTMLELAEACAEEVVVPNDIECCAFAGNKGILQPELNAHALRNLKKQLPRKCQRGFSNSVSCEIGLTNHSGRPYQSLLYLVDEVSQPL